MPHKSSNQDHPRVGGEKRQNLGPHTARKGSPPRGRGKDHIRAHFDRATRITPAWAGKSTRLSFLSVFSRDHPRVGGEKNQFNRKGEQGSGSPPRGRGKESQQLAAKCQTRITPAWAGKSFPSSSLPQTYWDHPRVGGEKLMPPRMGFWLRGSPPRGRGKV